MGFTAAWISVEGTDVGQTAEPIPDDHPVQSDATRQCGLCVQKGVYIYHF